MQPQYSTRTASTTGEAMMVAAQRLGIQLPRARREKLSKCQRSRARSGQLQCRVGWQLGSALLVLSQPVFQNGNFVVSAQ
jgi:hypothetical protein